MQRATRTIVLALLAVGCKRAERSNPPPVPAPQVVRPPAPQINGNDVNTGDVQVDAGDDGGAASPWDERGTSHRGSNDAYFTQDCPAGGTLGPVWGTDVYSDDSSICSAAVHAGRIIVRLGGPVMVFVQPGRASYAGSARHGVTSLSRAASPGSFSFSQMVPPEVGAGATAL